MTNLMSVELLGLYGGTFDPIHNGHILPVSQAAKQIGLNHITLVPCHIPPLKDKPSTQPAQRLDMVNLLCNENPLFEVDDCELIKSSPSYTIETLRGFRDRYPNHSLCFFMGMDSFSSLPRWHEWQSLLNYCHIVVCKREEQQTQLSTEMKQYFHRFSIDDPTLLRSCLNGSVFMADTSDVPISSSLIRQKVKQKQPWQQYVPESICQYIQKNRLYQD